jgi:hypothetical protein
MPGSASALHLAASLEQLHATFLTLVLPKVLSHGQVWSRHIKCPHRRDDFIAEMVGLSWKWFVRLVERGKDPTEFPTALAGYAARAVRSGRRVAGQEKPKEVLSPVAQARHNFLVEKLPDHETLTSNLLTLALQDNRKSPPDEQCAFRLDFPAWLALLGDRNRRIAEDMMLCERTLDLADRHGISPARVSQLRREFRQDWLQFCGDELLGV